MRNRSVKKLVPLNVLLVAALILTVFGPQQAAVAMRSTADTNTHPPVTVQQPQSAEFRFSALPQTPQLAAQQLISAAAAAALPQRQVQTHGDPLTGLPAVPGISYGQTERLSTESQGTDTFSAPINKSQPNSSQGTAAPGRNYLLFLPLVSQSAGSPPPTAGDPVLAAARAQLRTLGIHSWDRFSRSPVSIATGNYVQQFTDLNIPGVAGFDLLLQRTYNSLDSRQGLFGNGWSSLLDMGLRVNSDNSVDVRYADGSGAYFVPDGAGYAAGQGGVFDLLSSSGSEFLLTTVDQKVYHFAVDGDEAMLVSLNDRHGNEIQIARDGAGLPTQIVDSAGRKFGISLNGSRISAISDPLGRVTSYQQDGLGDLTAVTTANGGITQFSYENQWLTTLTDPEGIQYLTNSYDTTGRVTEQIDADGHTATFSYGAGQTVFSDSLGHLTTYHLDSDSRITQIIDALGNSELFAYDANHNVQQYTDKRGNSWYYDFNQRGNLLLRTDALGYVINYSYNGTNDLTSIRDQGGFDGQPRTTTFVYDSQGNLTQINRPDGSSQTATYDAAGQMLTMSDALGNTSSYDYDDHGNLTQITDPLGNSRQHSFDDVGRLTAVTDANGRTTAFEYDSSDNLIRRTDANGSVTQFEFDLNNCLIKMTDRRGGIFQTEYDSNLNVIAETDPEGHRTAFEYDAMGNRVTMTDPLGGQTLYRYDALYQLVEVEDALGNLSRFEYDADGNTTKMIDALGNISQFDYDALNRRIREINPLGYSLQRTFDEVGRLVKVIGLNGASTRYGYDELDRQTAMLDPLGNVWMTEYDAAGNIISQTDPNGMVTGYRYDGAGRLTAVIQNVVDGQPEDHQTNVTTSYGYDAAGNLTLINDANGESSSFSYDLLDRLTGEVDPLGNSRSYMYDADGNLISRTDGNGDVTLYSYDGDGLQLLISYPDGSGVSFEYDAGHNQVGMSDSLGDTQNEYDLLHQLLATSNHLGQTVSYQYDAAGNRTSITYPNGEMVAYEYDQSNLPVRVIDAGGDLFEASRDASHNITALTYPNQTTAAYTLDTAGRLTSVSSINGAGDVISAFDYQLDPVGNRIGAAARYFQQPDQLNTVYQYDPLYRLSRVEDSQGRFTEYSYDAVGNRTAMVTNHDPSGTGAAQPSSTEYSYNGANQLLTAVVERSGDGPAKPKQSRQVAQAVRAFIHETAAQSGHHIDELTADLLLRDARALLDLLAGHPAPAQADVAAALNALSAAVKSAELSGEIDNQGIANSLQVKLNRAKAANESQGSQLTTSFYFYDANGNRVQRLTADTGSGQYKDEQRTDYSYDFENRLVRVQDFTASAGGSWNAKGEVLQLFDGYGRMFRRAHNGQEWRDYVYDGLDPIMLFSSDSGVSSLTRGLGQILNAKDGQGTLTYFHYDGLGSVTGLSNDQGNSIRSYWYDPFGTVLDSSGRAASNFTDPISRLTYTGQEWDETSGLFHFYAREYDPQTGTWLQQDPLRGNPNEPMSLHRYQFVGNNPMTYVDQLGFSRSTLDNARFPASKMSADFDGTHGAVSGLLSVFTQNSAPLFELPGQGFAAVNVYTR